VSDTLVRLLGAAVGYDGRPVLSGVDVTVHRGDVLALVGPNGSGKSTLVKALLGLADLTSGTLEMFGSPDSNPHDRGRVGYVPQRGVQPGLVPSTVTEVVATGRLASGRLLRRLGADDRAAVTEALERVGLASLARARVANLSGGQQRRVLIARALAAKPELLILDEPLAGVDLASQESLAATLSDLARTGTTFIIVLHELGPLRPLVTRVLQLRAGAVAYDGPVTPEVLDALHEEEFGRHLPHHEHTTDGDASDDRPGLGLTG
jgi:zinc transport system ATP-binding protein